MSFEPRFGALFVGQAYGARVDYLNSLELEFRYTENLDPPSRCSTSNTNHLYNVTTDAICRRFQFRNSRKGLGL